MSSQFLPPNNEDSFESLCLALFARHWNAPDTQRNGRRGHRQNGVDFYGVGPDGRVRAGQSKLHAPPHKLTEDEVRIEVEKAKTFRFALHSYSIATTSKRDPTLQALAAQLTLEHRANGLFDVVIYSWDDLCELGVQYEEIWLTFQQGVSAAVLRSMTESVDRVSTPKGFHNLFSYARAEESASAHAVFEERYLDCVLKQYSRLSLLGVRDLRELKQQIGIAYVSLRVKAQQGKEATVAPAEEWLAKSPLVTVRGPAGSGKTTLLSWMAVQCAGSSSDNQWKGGIPFVVRLRELGRDGKARGDIGKLVESTIDPMIMPLTPPEGWVLRVLQDKRGILLIDGVDELPPKLREDFWAWVRDLLDTYPGNRIVITSRHFPTSGRSKALWNPPRQFTSADLEEMDDDDITIFVDRWHSSLLSLEEDPIVRKSIQDAREALPIRLAEGPNARVRDLCRTPLLCSLICMLHLKEEGYLPSKRVDLYERCCALLIEERDEKRRIPPPPPPLSFLTKDDKELLLQRLALDMMRNTSPGPGDSYRVEVERTEAIKWIEPHLNAMERNEARLCDPAAVLDHLIERVGLLREPAVGWVDFPHRTFQEYFAACAAGALWQSGSLTKYASNDQWHETIVLAAGTKTGGVAFGQALIRGLLDIGENSSVRQSIRHTAFALAIGCLDTAKQIDQELRNRVLSHLADIVPPTNFAEAKGLAAAGDAIVSHLQYTPETFRDLKIRTASSCVRTLSLVNSERAVRTLIDPNFGYISDSRPSVVAQMCRCSKIDPLSIPAIIEEIVSRGYIPDLYSRHVRSLELIRKIPGIKALGIGADSSSMPSKIESIEPIADLGELRGLVLANLAHVRDFSAVSRLERLRVFAGVRLPVLTDISALAARKQLEWLDLLFCPQVRSLECLSSLHKLKRLALNGLSVAKLPPLGAHPNLVSLRVINTPIEAEGDWLGNLSHLTSLSLSEPLSPSLLANIAKLGNLEVLELWNATTLRSIDELGDKKRLLSLGLFGANHLESLSGLAQWSGLRELTITSGRSVRSLAGVAQHAGLKHLCLKDFSEVESLSELTSLTELVTLEIEGFIKVTDISPLRALNKLRRLSVRGCSSLESIDFLREIKSLRVLNIDETRITGAELGDLRVYSGVQFYFPRPMAREHFLRLNVSTVGSIVEQLVEMN